MEHCWSCNLGTIEYNLAFELQQKLAVLRKAEVIDDILLVLEHPPTVTLGKFGKAENILATSEELDARGIRFCETNRGGDVTFHCPGQLVVYPIMDVRKQGGKIRQFLTRLEEVVIRVVRSFDIDGSRWDEHPGIWVGDKQIAAIGLHFTRGISMHGISLNVNPDLEAFGVINLCGLPGTRATSIRSELDKPINLLETSNCIMDAFESVFGVKLEPISKQQVLEDVFGQKAAGLV